LLLVVRIIDQTRLIDNTAMFILLYFKCVREFEEMVPM
jgi:hypothetical protein